ncbi:MAG TPA: hypothetical protein VLA82_08815 [Actinomycetota bacterium]|nr:hypothetical protein [Actinomycetota bacterium]
MGWLGYGDPSWRINADGGWDFVPLLLACGALLVLRIVFGVRIRWYLALAVVLAAPLFRAFGDRVGMPVAVGLALLVTAVAVPAARRSGRQGPPSRSV